MTHDNKNDRTECDCGAPLVPHDYKLLHLCATGQHVYVWHQDTGEEFVYILVENPEDVIETAT